MTIVSLCVCPFATLVYCVEMAEYIFSNFSAPNSRIILKLFLTANVPAKLRRGHQQDFKYIYRNAMPAA